MPPPTIIWRLLRGGCRIGVLWLALALAMPVLALAQGVDLNTLQVKRQDGALTLDFAAQLVLPSPVEDALRRGVPLYFVAEAQLYRSRWYWRDERIARVVRSWRLAYQPLTFSWRVSMGGLNQSHATLAEALNAVSRRTDWRLVDLSLLDADKSHYIEFSYRLDNSQLPSPMQINLGVQSAWAVGVEQTLRLD